MALAPPVGADLRLLAPAGALWVTLLAAAKAPPQIALYLAAVTGLVAVALCWAVPHAGAPAPRCADARIGVTAALVCVAAGFAIIAVRAHARAEGPLAGLARRGAIAELTVDLAADPIRHDGIDRITGRHYALIIVPAQAVQVDSGGHRWRLRQPVLLLATDDSWLGLLPSQRVRTAGQLHPPRAGDTVSAVVDVRGTPRLRGRPSLLQRSAGRLRAGLRHAVAGLPAGPRGLLPGLVDGDTSAMSPATNRQFQRTGLTHLVAVSGENVVIVSGSVVWVARRMRASPRLAGVLALLAVLGFVVLARPSASVLRAAVMGGLGIVGLLLSRPRAALTGLAAAVLVLLVVEPGLAAQPGFTLSVCATLGLLVLAPGWRRALARWLPDPVAAAVAVPAAAQAACAPVIAMIGGGVSVLAVPANLLAAPAVGPATVAGVLAAAAAPILPWFARGCAYLGGVPCGWLLGVAHVGSVMPFAAVGWPAGVAGGLLLAAAMVAAHVALRGVTGRPPRRPMTVPAARRP